MVSSNQSIDGCCNRYYAGDYDGAAWLYNQLLHNWDDPKRGEVRMSRSRSCCYARVSDGLAPCPKLDQNRRRRTV